MLFYSPFFSPRSLLIASLRFLQGASISTARAFLCVSRPRVNCSLRFLFLYIISLSFLCYPFLCVLVFSLTIYLVIFSFALSLPSRCQSISFRGFLSLLFLSLPLFLCVSHPPHFFSSSLLEGRVFSLPSPA